MLFAEFNMDDALRVSKEEGIIEGEIRGEIRGEIKGITKTAINLLKKGMSIFLISEVTGMTEKDIERLQDNLAKSNDKK